jgi:uncharacterized membrane protein YbhN (UPF0104 family)
MRRVPATAARWALRGIVLTIIGVLLLRMGAAPFVLGLQRLTGTAVLVALAATAATTVLSAWRWTLLSRALGSPLRLRTAVSSYYRSQFLNSVLPGGVTGDLDRGLRNRAGGERRLQGLRVVTWDRGTGQIVQLAMLAAVLPAFNPRFRLTATAAALAVTALVGAALIVAHRASPPTGGLVRRAAAALRHDLRRIVQRPATVLALIGTSVIVALMHASVFVLAAVITGASFDPMRLLPLALAIQLAMAVPVGFGGLGPREGMAAVVFTGAGLGAAQGVSAAIAYGALALIAVVPGLVPLAWPSMRSVGSALSGRRTKEGAR